MQNMSKCHIWNIRQQDINWEVSWFWFSVSLNVAVKWKVFSCFLSRSRSIKKSDVFVLLWLRDAFQKTARSLWMLWMLWRRKRRAWQRQLKYRGLDKESENHSNPRNLCWSLPSLTRPRSSCFNSCFDSQKHFHDERGQNHLLSFSTTYQNTCLVKGNNSELNILPVANSSLTKLELYSNNIFLYQNIFGQAISDIIALS